MTISLTSHTENPITNHVYRLVLLTICQVTIWTFVVQFYKYLRASIDPPNTVNFLWQNFKTWKGDTLSRETWLKHDTNKLIKIAITHKSPCIFVKYFKIPSSWILESWQSKNNFFSIFYVHSLKMTHNYFLNNICKRLKACMIKKRSFHTF